MKRSLFSFLIVLTLWNLSDSEITSEGKLFPDEKFEKERIKNKIHQFEIPSKDSQQGKQTQNSNNVKYTVSGIPKIVWTYWNDQLSENDHFYKIFVFNRKAMLRGWEIRELNQRTVWKWLREIPDFDDTLYRQQFLDEEVQKKADLIRLALLKHYGGVWMDFTIILIENFDWLDRIDQQQDIDYKFGESPDVFFMYNSNHGVKEKALDTQTGKQFLLFPTLQLFFIAAKPGNKFLQQVFDFFVFGHAQGFRSYSNHKKQSYFLDIVNNEFIETGGFQTKFFEVQIAIQIILQRKQRQLDMFYHNKVDEIRRFAVKQYKIWVMGTSTSAYYYDGMPGSHLIDIVVQSDLDVLKRNNLYPKYFLKLFSQTSQQLKDYLITEKQKFEKLLCKWDYYITENSFLYRFLLENYPIKFYYNLIESNGFAHGCYGERLQRQNNLIQSKKQQEESILGTNIIISYLLIILSLVAVHLRLSSFYTCLERRKKLSLDEKQQSYYSKDLWSQQTQCYDQNV